MKRKAYKNGFKWTGNAKEIREALKCQHQAIVKEDKKLKSTLAHVLHTCVNGDIN